MMQRIPINLAVEDDLSERVLRRILDQRPRRYAVGPVYCQGGFGYLRKRAASFNNAAKAAPFLLLTDLDQCPCPPQLISDWLGTSQPRHPHFVFRIAVRSVESWLLADNESLCSFLGIRRTSRAVAPEELPNPKSTLLALAAQSRYRDIRDAMVSRDERSGRFLQGPDYNGALAPYVGVGWDVRKAQARCPSLAGLLRSLGRLEKSYR